MIYCFNFSTKAMYSCLASSEDFPLTAFQASHFAFPVKSNIPGRGVLQSPTVPCLYNAYSCSKFELSGFADKFLASSAAFVKESDIGLKKYINQEFPRQSKRIQFTVLDQLLCIK
eukprot:NODE_100_length_20777_cov_0.240884.p21 type:complete len:115 gc:universal NODE_100_length_20777_cov_0.240884:14943-15287(+)